MANLVQLPRNYVSVYQMTDETVLVADKKNNLLNYHTPKHHLEVMLGDDNDLLNTSEIVGTIEPNMSVIVVPNSNSATFKPVRFTIKNSGITELNQFEHLMNEYADDPQYAEKLILLLKSSAGIN
jgi:hypothetical protein